MGSAIASIAHAAHSNRISLGAEIPAVNVEEDAADASMPLALIDKNVLVSRPPLPVYSYPQYLQFNTI